MSIQTKTLCLAGEFFVRAPSLDSSCFQLLHSTYGLAHSVRRFSHVTVAAREAGLLRAGFWVGGQAPAAGRVGAHSPRGTRAVRDATPLSGPCGGPSHQQRL